MSATTSQLTVLPLILVESEKTIVGFYRDLDEHRGNANELLLLRGRVQRFRHRGPDPEERFQCRTTTILAEIDRALRKLGASV